ncbi:PLEKHH1 [Cordylochernes scorpioides]|uniref:PLEKHH1 n=1 Tax=Cordylochernes scorpioides TaxID=51811 RepID=A0ABY6LQM3_9ARAC|nr:PLEKHH1 [Cordylochernes scorpioides]
MKTMLLHYDIGVHVYRRLYFRHSGRAESEKERLLLAYQISQDVAEGRFPLSRELALEMGGLMLQIEYGDLSGAAEHGLQAALSRFFPRRYQDGPQG